MSVEPDADCPKSSSSNWHGKLVLSVQLLLGVIFGVMAGSSFSSRSESFGTIFSVFSIGSFIAAVTRGGWLIPCLVLGITLGSTIFAGPGVRDGTAESHLWDLANTVARGTILAWWSD